MALSKSMKATVLGIARRAKGGEYESGDLMKALLNPDAPLEPESDPDEAPEVDTEAYAKVLTTLFDPIVGYDDVKWLMRRAVMTDEPVHVLLEGPPASAKTLFLMEIARLPRAEFAVAGNATKAGLTDLLLVYRPRYLLVDEVETIDSLRDYAALLHLMENQEVVETKYRRHERTPLKTWVFAAGNDASKLPPALLSRFGGKAGVVHFKEYSSAEFVEIAANILVQRERIPLDFAKRVALATLDLGSRDVRLAVRFARLCKTDEDLAKVVETLRRRR